MNKKIMSFVLCIITLLCVLTPSVCAETQEAEVELTLNPNKRYTDIFYPDEVNDPLLDLDEDLEERENKRDGYVAVLVVLLVVALGVLVYTLRKAPDEDKLKKIDDEQTPKTKIIVTKKKKETSIEEEEKKE